MRTLIRGFMCWRQWNKGQYREEIAEIFKADNCETDICDNEFGQTIQNRALIPFRFALYLYGLFKLCSGNLYLYSLCDGTMTMAESPLYACSMTAADSFLKLPPELLAPLRASNCSGSCVSTSCDTYSRVYSLG